MTTQPADIVWSPDESFLESLAFTHFCEWLRDTGRANAEQTRDYASVHEWSIADVERFWCAFAEYVDVPLDMPAGARATPATLPGGEWFPGCTVNYAAVALGSERDGDAVVALDEDGTRRTLSWAELRDQVGAVAAYLRSNGVVKGSRVCAVLPNRLEAVVAFLATASLGAVWSVVAPEFGVEAIVARLHQLEPVVVIATATYDYNGKVVDRREVLAEVLAALPTVGHVIWVGETRVQAPSWMSSSTWKDAHARAARWVAEPTSFSDPLWVLSSSGTTGVPKGIVHGHGGVVLEHLKTLTLHSVLRPRDRLFVIGSTSWVVWNMLVSGLLRGATIVLLDGNPAYPSVDRAFEVAEAEGVRMVALGAAYLHAAMRAGICPAERHDLSKLAMLQVTGSPLIPDAYTWVSENVGELWLASTSGGTDVAGIFLGGAPQDPVRAGRLQRAALGVAAAAWNADGQPVTGEPGELVITEPMPSMPLYFWNDPDGERFRDAYFATFPGVWRHGDLVEFDPDGSSVILGRSDSTLNRNGVRLGPADLYRVAEGLAGVNEALVVGVERGDEYYMPMFVHLTDDADEEETIASIRAAIRAALSPRYLPDAIIPVTAIPHTRTGKKLEVPIKRLIQGASLDTVVDPGSVDDFPALARIRDLVVPAGEFRR